MTHQLTLFGYGYAHSMPKLVRNRTSSPYHSDTSKAAYAAIKPKLNALQAKVLAEIARHGETGCTCFDVEQSLGMLHQNVSARCRELHLMRRIFDTGKRKITRGNSTGRVYRAID